MTTPTSRTRLRLRRGGALRWGRPRPGQSWKAPWRVVLMASSSWSHAFLTAKNHWVYPDLEADRELLAHLRSGDLAKWKDVKLSKLEESGEQEVLNWFCLVGAMSELGREANILEWAETWAFNAPKCMAVFK